MADNIEKNTTALSQEMTPGMRADFSALNILVSALDILTGTLQTTLQGIQDSPAGLLFKRRQENRGPGEDGYHEK
jgi:phospholipid/cholesterol/gamma-HCH transport system substrate-binding protein